MLPYSSQKFNFKITAGCKMCQRSSYFTILNRRTLLFTVAFRLSYVFGRFFPAWFVFREPKRRAVYFPHHTNQLVASTCRLRSRVFNHTHTQCVDVLTSFSGCFIWLCACASLSLHDCWNQLLLVRLARKKQSSTQQFKLFLEHSAARRQEKGSDFRLPRKMATNVARSIICLSVFFHWVIVQCSL